jgi:subtilisin family serine protease
MRSTALSVITMAALAAILAAAATGAASRAAAGHGAIKRDPSTILVKFAKPAQAHALAAQQGDTEIGETAGKVSIVRLHAGKGVDDALDRYQHRRDVVFAEPNFLASATLAAPNDPSFKSQYGLVRIGATDGWGVYPGSYSAAAGPTIAVVDTGVDVTHPDLSGHLLLGSAANCLSGICDRSASVADDEGHGTHVAGIAAALANNQTGIAGVAFNSPLLPVKALDSTGTGSYAAISSAIAWAADHGAKVINLSLGGYAYSATLCAAVGSAVDAGVLVVAAAGNDGVSDPFYPAACPGAVGVSATTSNDVKASFSNFGSPDVFVSAPGESIYSTYTGGGYTTLSGTSMATPFVSALGALLFGQSSSRTVFDVRAILATTSDKVGGTDYGNDPYGTCTSCTWSPLLGYGRINAAKALGAPTPPPPPPPPPALFPTYQATSVGSWPEAVAIGDVTGDGLEDVVMTTSYYFDAANDFHLFVFAQAPDGSLLTPVSYLTAGGYSTRPASVVIADITGDGRADVVVGDNDVGVEVFPQLPSGVLGTSTLTASTNSDKIRAGDFNRDGRPDIAGIGWGTTTADVFLNNGHGGLDAPLHYAATNAGYEDLEVGDVTGDGLDDLVVMSGQSWEPNFGVVAQLPGGGFAPQVYYSVGVSGGVGRTHGSGIGGLNGDGRNHVVSSYGGNSPTSFIAVFTQTAGGALGTPVSYASYDIPEPVDVADVDGDGRSDVVTLHGGWNKACVYRQRPDGTLAAEERYSIPYASHYNPHGLALGDVNSDGSTDIALADYNHGLVVLRNGGVVPPPPPVSVPGTPVLTTTGGNHSITLSWTAPAANGSPITAYNIYRGVPNGAALPFLTSVGNVTTFTDTSPANGTSYTYQVSAVNGAGEGPRSNRSAATAASAPSAPGLVSATASGQSVDLTWTAPADDGGSAVTGYRIYRSTTRGAEVPVATTGTGTSFTDTSTAYGSTYYYEVTAVNAVGESARSNELSVTLVAPDSTPPSTPGNVHVGATGTAQLILDWSASADNVGVTGYQVYRDGALLSTVTPTVFLDSALAAGSTHTYVVRAVDAAGNQSQPSATLNAKTAQASKGKNGTVSGVVVNAAGDPLANVTVSIAGSNKQQLSTTTGANGAWSLGNLTAATYTLNFTRAGSGPQSASVTVTAGGTQLTLTTFG